MFFRTKSSGTRSLSPDRREPLGGQTLPATRRRHLGPNATSSSRPANSMPCSLGGRDSPGRSSSSPLTPRADARSSTTAASARLSSSSGSGNRPAAGGLSSNFWGRAASSSYIERAVFLTVLHRLFEFGSDRAADKWKKDYQIEDCDALQLHHLYRAMAWLGQVLPKGQQKDQTPFEPRCVKDQIEEALFAHRRDLFTELQLVFFETTSIDFEGDGGESLGQRGFTKDHRPDLKQMIVGAVLDGQGRPICCELWPGNTTDVTTLIPVVDRLLAAGSGSARSASWPTGT